MVKYRTDTTQQIAAEAGSALGWASALLPGLGLFHPTPIPGLCRDLTPCQSLAY